MSWKHKMAEAQALSGRLLFDGVEEFREEFPNLTELLVGCEATGSMGALPPFKLTLFVREGALRFSCSSAEWPQWGVGELRDATKGLAAVEEALREGRVAWKNDSPQKGGSKGR